MGGLPSPGSREGPHHTGGRCKTEQAFLDGANRVGRCVAEDPKWRMLSSWGLQAWDKFLRAQSAEQADQDPHPKLRGRTAKAQEVFAGTGRVT
eukprot:8857396-Heterocapsa_arctica.AAC.1